MRFDQKRLDEKGSTRRLSPLFYSRRKFPFPPYSQDSCVPMALLIPTSPRSFLRCAVLAKFPSWPGTVVALYQCTPHDWTLGLPKPILCCEALHNPSLSSSLAEVRLGDDGNNARFSGYWSSTHHCKRQSTGMIRRAAAPSCPWGKYGETEWLIV